MLEPQPPQFPLQPPERGGIGRTGPTLKGAAPVLRFGALIMRAASFAPHEGQATVV